MNVGDIVSHYRILGKLGQGGMGVVYKAEDLKLDRAVALKFLPPHLGADASARSRFVQEAKTASALDHPNICTIYEIDATEDGRTFIAMAYYEGEPLDRKLENGPLSVDEAIRTAAQVARGLARAHARGIVHRDIKPGNIVVTRDGEAKILDFGLARLVGVEHATEISSTLGTVAYMSPEQARGGDVDQRTDLWSLGVVLYEMLTGKLPFRGEHPQAVIYSILNEAPTPISSLAPSVPRALQAIVDQALCKDPAARQQGADALRSQLAGMLDDPTLSFDTARLRRAAAPWRRARRWIVLGSILALAFAGSLAMWRLRTPSQATSPAPAATSVAVFPFSYRGSDEFRYLGEGIVDLLSAKLDGAGALRSIDPRAIAGLASQRQLAGVFDPGGARLAALKLGAKRYVLGNLVEVGGRLQVDASLYDAGGRPGEVAHATADGEVSRAFDLVDQVALGLLAGLGEGASSRIDRVAAVTTASLPALKAYLEGESAFQRGDFQTSVEALQRAVDIDAGFALAWYRLSIALEWKGTPQDLQENAAEQAYRHADRLTDRERRLLEALRVWRNGRNAEAKQLYLSIVHAYPDEIEGWYQLGEVLFHRNALYGVSFTESRGAFEHVLSFEPQHIASMLHLARIEAFEGRTAEMNNVIGRFLSRSKESVDRNLEIRALRAFCLDDREQEEGVLADLERADAASLAMAFTDVSLYGRQLAGAERIARVMTASSRPPDVRSFGHVALAHFRLAAGQWAEAKQELDAASVFDPWASAEYRALFVSLPFLPVPRAELAAVRDRLDGLVPASALRVANRAVFIDTHQDLHPLLRMYLLALVSSQMGDIQRAEAYAAQIEQQQFPVEYRALAADLALGVRAQLARTRGRPQEALAALERIPTETKNPLESPLVSEAYERFTRAQLLFELKRYDEALAWYEHLGESSIFEFIYLPIAHLWRGEIYDRLGKRDEAALHYARFIESWQGCDPQLRPMVELARRKLAALNGSDGTSTKQSEP
jgi:tetratricopeptide (TPR) repeat protein/predicted Ser/Thr protein kinase